MKHIILITLAINLASPAHALDCGRNDLDQTSINMCAKSDWKSADVDLNATYKRANAMAKQMDQYIGSDDKPAATMLRDAQRAWIPFRDAACDAESTIMRGGSAQSMLYWGCMARLTRQRSEDLRYFFE